MYVQTAFFKIDSVHFSVTNRQAFLSIRNKFQFQDIIFQQFMANGIWKK